MEVRNNCKQNQRIVAGSQHKGAATEILVTVSTTSESAYQGNNPLLSETTQAVRQRRCMKWTDEINIFVMRAYYRITNLETDVMTYRDQPYGEFIEKHPGTFETAQRISDQYRVIVRNDQLLPAVLEQIGSELANCFSTESDTDSDDQQNA
jgi:hypothetical protein